MRILAAFFIYLIVGAIVLAVVWLFSGDVDMARRAGLWTIGGLAALDTILSFWGWLTSDW